MRSLMTLLLALALGLAALPALAAERMPFDQARFAAAQREGKPILVDISATWCPTCAAQKPILARLTARQEFKDLVIFDVDFDAQKTVVRRFRATMQSTLIAFKGAVEKSRSVGDTDEASIAKLLHAAEG